MGLIPGTWVGHENWAWGLGPGPGPGTWAWGLGHGAWAWGLGLGRTWQGTTGGKGGVGHKATKGLRQKLGQGHGCGVWGRRQMA